MCNGGTLCINASCDENSDQCVYQASGLCSVTGAVRYYRDARGVGSEPSTKPVPNVGVDSTGDAGPEATTDSDGRFALSNLAGNVTVKTLPKFGTPRASDHNDAVSSFDALLIARHSVQLISLTGKQQLAGDVSGNGVVSAYDSGLISQFVAEKLAHLPVATTKNSDWQFLRCASYPSCTTPEYTYTPLSGPEVADFYALLYGDVSGNWAKASTLASTQSSTPTEQLEAEAIENDRALAARLAGTGPVQIPRRTGDASIVMESKAVSTRKGNLSTILVSVGNAAGIQGLDLTLGYDASKISIVDVQPVDRLAGYNAIWNANNGSLQIAFYGFAPLTKQSKLVEITFRPNGMNKVVPPRLVRAFANEGAIPMRVTGAPLLPPKTPPAVVSGAAPKKSTLRK